MIYQFLVGRSQYNILFGYIQTCGKLFSVPDVEAYGKKRLGELESFMWQALQLPTSLRIFLLPELSFTDLSAWAKLVLNMVFLILGKNRLGNELCACAAVGQPENTGNSHSESTAKRELPGLYFWSNIVLWNLKSFFDSWAFSDVLGNIG